MAHPVVASVTDTDFATSVTSLPINMPATVNAGERLKVFIHVRNAGTWNTIPTGWSSPALVEQAGGGSVGELSIFEKIADGTEGGTTPTWITSVATTAACQTLRETGVHASTASEATPASGDASSANPPSETASWGGSEDNLFLAVAGHSASSTAAWSAAPSDYTGFAQNGASSGGAAVCIAHGYRQLTADTDNPGTFTVSGSNRWWAAATIVIRPAADEEVTIDPADVAIGVTMDETTITQDHVIQPQDIAVGLTADGATINQNHIIAPDDVAVGVTEDETTVEESYNITPADIAVAVTEDNGSISQNHVLSVDDILVALGIDAGTIAQDHIIVTQDIAIAVTEDSTDITQVHVIVVQDITVALTEDDASISQLHVLVLQDIAVALTEDAAALLQNHIIAPQDVSVGVTEDGTTILQVHTITGDDILVTVSEDVGSITQEYTISVDDIAIAVTLDETTLSDLTPIIEQLVAGSVSGGVKTGRPAGGAKNTTLRRAAQQAEAQGVADEGTVAAAPNSGIIGAED